MKLTKVIVTIIIVTSSLSCGVIGDRVEQVVDKECAGLCQSGTCLTTYVWYDNEIVKSWRDDINIVTDSLVKIRQKQADELLGALKKCR
jgi:hypothetical protein